ncbi:MAG: hypothetical protein Q8L71_12420 [Thiobacillus sp.]|nr:hypothetical protein [Thiobacillus sp.]
MSDTLIGVIIGGLIGSIGPLSTLILGHHRWKREAKLEYLKSERIRLEGLFERTLKQFAEGIEENSYSSNMASDIMVLMPSEVSEKYLDFMADKDKTDLKCKHAYLDLALAMKKILSSLDTEIRNVVS